MIDYSTAFNFFCQKKLKFSQPSADTPKEGSQTDRQSRKPTGSRKPTDKGCRPVLSDVTLYYTGLV